MIGICIPTVAGNENSDASIERQADSHLPIIDESHLRPKKKENRTPLFTFEQLLTKPETSAGKKVRVKGLLTYWATCNGGDMFIFPDKEALQIESPKDGIQIRLRPKFHLRKDFVKEYPKGALVEVTGVFREGHRLTGIISTTPRGYIDKASLTIAH